MAYVCSRAGQVTEKFYEKTKRLLDAKPADVSLTTLAKSAGLKPSWLTAFSRGEIPDPGVKKVQALHDALEALKARPHV